MCPGGTGGPLAPRSLLEGNGKHRAVGSDAHQASTGTPAGAGYSRAVDLPVTFDGRPGLPDTLGRALRDLRISVTDRCNFRCTYCMPKEVFGKDYAFLPKDQVLTFEEIERLARAFVGLGVEKLRITGGEPLVRRDLPTLIAELAAIRRPDGGEVDLTLTTNGSALRALARPLADAGLKRVTVSLDSLDDATFGAMNGIDFPVAKVLDGIAAAIEAGLTPVKINMVVRRGVNESSIVPMAAWARDIGATLRFIEYMDVGHSNGWQLDEVVPAEELIERARAPSGRVEPADPNYRGEVADRWRYRRRTRRVRGHLVGDAAVLPRLHAGPAVGRGQALHVPVRRPGPATPGPSCAAARSTTSSTTSSASVWSVRSDRYSELRSAATSTLPKIEMFAMGG